MYQCGRLCLGSFAAPPFNRFLDSELCQFRIIAAAHIGEPCAVISTLELCVNCRHGQVKVLCHPDKEYLQYCLTEIQAFMASLGLELNEKTQIFPLRHGMDFLGFHTYLTDSGKVIRKLRHSSVKKMRAKLRRWEKEYPTGLVTREEILQSWQAWDAHAAHGNTWTLRQQVRDRVQNILKEEI